MDDPIRLLLVEDDEDLGPSLRAYLGLHGFEVVLAATGPDALRRFSAERFDVCVLDVMLPRLDGFDVAARLRAESDLPILFLTARGDRLDRLKGFHVGGDDYVTKPVDEEELVARLRALARRARAQAGGAGAEELCFGRCRLDPRRGRLDVGDRSHRLTPREVELLALLAGNRDRLVTRRDALLALWGRDDYFNRRSMDVFVYRLRKHLADDPGTRITTVRGRGLVLEVDAD